MRLRAFALTLLSVPALAACETLGSGRDDDGGGGAERPRPEGRLEIRSRSEKGPVVYVVNGPALRSPGDGRAGDWFRDGAKIRRGGADGKVAFHFERGELRQAGATGAVLLTIRGRKVFRGASDDVIFVVRDGVVHRGDAAGTRVLWIDPDCPDWALAMALHGMY